MIRAIFKRSRGFYSGISISGHSGYSDEGTDIVCAAVTSAVQLVSNGITEVIKAPMEVCTGENRIDLFLPSGSLKEAYHFMEALYLHLDILSQQYGDFIEITAIEE